MDREIEMMICLKEHVYTITLDGKTISFPVQSMMRIWDILNEERNGKLNEEYDAYYDTQTGEWLEGKCDNPEMALHILNSAMLND